MAIGTKEGRKREREPPATAWRQEPEPKDDPRSTRRGEFGWHSWNNMSPELEFCELAALLAQFLRPKRAIETGTGQGFATRRIAARLGEGQKLVCYEADPRWRKALASTSFFQQSSVCSLSPRKSPAGAELASAELCVLDSRFPHRRAELERWWKHAPPGAVVLVHDTGNEHPEWTPHMQLRKLILDLAIPGTFLKNPRGAFLGVKTARERKGAKKPRAASKAA